jgi:hypothetical protein
MSKILEQIKKEFVDWAFEQKDLSEGRFEIAMRVWVEKELKIRKLKLQVKKQKEIIGLLEKNLK